MLSLEERRQSPHSLLLLRSHDFGHCFVLLKQMFSFFFFLCALIEYSLSALLCHTHVKLAGGLACYTTMLPLSLFAGFVFFSVLELFIARD